MVPSDVAKPDRFELPDGTPVTILYEDRGVLAIDKPAGWMLGPDDAEHHERSLHRALVDEIEERAWWAASRNLKFLRFVHRLDAPTTGVLLLSKSQGAMSAFSKIFAERVVSKAYLAVVDGVPRESSWICREPLGPDPELHGRHRVDRREGKEAETSFQVLQSLSGKSLILAKPVTGRTHQIRLHLRHAGTPVMGDILYGTRDTRGLALRSFRLEYPDPFLKRRTVIIAPVAAFCRTYGFDPAKVPAELLQRPSRRPPQTGEGAVADGKQSATPPQLKSKDPSSGSVHLGNLKPKSASGPGKPHGMAEHPPKSPGGQGAPDRA